MLRAPPRGERGWPGGMLGHAAGARMLRRAACAHTRGARVTGDACWGMLQAPARGARGALMTGLLPQKIETTNRLLLRLLRLWCE